MERDVVKWMAGQWKKGSIPEKWNGKAAERIVVELERLLGWAAEQPGENNLILSGEDTELYIQSKEEVVRFEWDDHKNLANQRKHGVSFELAAMVFNDPVLISVLDERKNYDEERWMSIGLVTNVLLYVAHTVRVNKHDEEIIRVISCRKAIKKERNKYIQANT